MLPERSVVVSEILLSVVASVVTMSTIYFSVNKLRITLTIRYDTIRYDSVYLTCSKKQTSSQLSLPHGIDKN